MFEHPFSFDGRIRRTEYGVSLIIYSVSAVIINLIMVANPDLVILGLAYIPLIWFLWAQGAKRCHDLGNSGWYQIIPLYGLWMVFQDGQPLTNEHGVNPKQASYTINVSSNKSGNPSNFNNGGYSSGYNGGHNNQTPSTNNLPQSQDNTTLKEYKDGDLYN